MNKIMKKGFSLIELNVVVAIIAIASIVIIAATTYARREAEDAARIEVLSQLSIAVEEYYFDNGEYPPSIGWVKQGANIGVLNNILPYYDVNGNNFLKSTEESLFMYWRKDYRSPSYGCMTAGNKEEIGLYLKVKDPTDAMLKTITDGDSFDQCVASIWGMNYVIR